MSEKPQKILASHPDRFRLPADLGLKSENVLSPCDVPKDTDEFLLSNGIAAVDFLKSLGQDSITAEDIGIDEFGRLFRITHSNRISQELEFIDKVQQHDVKHGLPSVREHVVDAICQYLAEISNVPEECTHLRNLTASVKDMLCHFDDQRVSDICEESQGYYAYFESLFKSLAEVEEALRPKSHKVLTARLWLEFVDKVEEGGIKTREDIRAMNAALRMGQYDSMRALVEGIQDEYGGVLDIIESLFVVLDPARKTLRYM
ncbi:hypothetical protein QBC34DRAFT_415268 [Podospora aff. communis PSN243]|uniref:Uncharacterized protein n=1 Tax=Podospora aff. communis PSN243 TaxID=3040156 RepID=A0AAV9G8F1_9PEZI|nr:hypothetical protein QBC34DRAFT_415268 [Podospora aff. communis PSN243]